MKIELDLPEDLLEGLRQGSQSKGLSLEAYVAERIVQILAQGEMGESGKIENRPDWQAALDRSRADLAAGRVHAHDEVVQWHRSQSASPGRKNP